MTGTPLKGRQILLIMSGGIAAYKSLDMIRRFRDAGALVRCVLTKGAEQFVTPLTVATLSGDKVYDDLWSLNDEHKVGHIRLARECDVVIVAPATANLLAKMTHGLADDLASTVLLATQKPVLVAPAMNSAMWAHPATKANVDVLKKRGVTFVGPEAGAMACDENGVGRMSEPMDIYAAVLTMLGRKGPLAGKRALVTSGPTYEPLDPVRFIGNHSSGKQGHAIAAALMAQGAEVVLVSGPVSLKPPNGVDFVCVETAREMLTACEEALPVDIAVCAAAVADWRPADEASHKMKKGASLPEIHLIENPDILAALAKHATHPPKLVIGFAAETKDVILNAEEKFRRKGCDWIVANEVGAGKVFGEDQNEVTLLRLDETGEIVTQHWPKQSKEGVAVHLVEEIVASFKKDKKV